MSFPAAVDDVHVVCLRVVGHGIRVDLCLHLPSQFVGISVIDLDSSIVSVYYEEFF